MSSLLATYALSFAIIVAAVLGLAIGVLNGRPAPEGRCGRSCRCINPRCKKKECPAHASDHLKGP